MESDILSNYVFNREFPLGVEERLVQDRQGRMRSTRSGLHVVRHKDDERDLVTMAVYLATLGARSRDRLPRVQDVAGLASWTIADTMEDVTDPANAQKIVDRQFRAGAISPAILLARCRPASTFAPAHDPRRAPTFRLGGALTVASLLDALTFSLSGNGIARQVWVDRPVDVDRPLGMTLGGAWGFILDSGAHDGSDEGFREVPVVADSWDG